MNLMRVYITILLYFIIMLCSCSSKFPIDLGSGYKIDYDGNGDWCILDGRNSVVIPPHITKYDYNKNFIIVEEKPKWIILKGEDPNMKYRDLKNKFEKSSLLYYWIIDKTHITVFNIKANTYLNVYGPLNKQEYIKKLEQLKVPNELTVHKH